MVDERIVEIGNRIKHLRRLSNLSLRDLAEYAGISASTIHKIESNGMVPSISILMKIAQALKKNVSDLIGEEDRTSQVVHVKSQNREILHVKDSRLRVENVASFISNCQLEVTILNIRRGGTSGAAPLVHTGEEIKFCLKGTMEYIVDGERFVLDPGDCLHFKSDAPHTWRNTGKEGARVLSVCTPPTFRWFLNRKQKQQLL
jgi:transcriptional regulator with XRE-family HTH domain